MFGKKKKFIVVRSNSNHQDILFCEETKKRVKPIEYASRTVNHDEGLNHSDLIGFVSDFIKEKKIRERNVILVLPYLQNQHILRLTCKDQPQKLIHQQIIEIMSAKYLEQMDDHLVRFQTNRNYFNDSGENFIDITAVTTPQKYVNVYLTALQECGLHPVSVCHDSFNSASLLPPSQEEDKIEAILMIADDKFIFNVYKGSKLIYVRKLSVRFNRIIKALTKPIYNESGVSALTAEEAGQFLKEIGLENNPEMNVNHMTVTNAFPLIRPLLEMVIRELKTCFVHMNNDDEELIPENIYLCGNQSEINELDTYLEMQLGIKIKRIHSPGKIKQHLPKKFVSKEVNIENVMRLVSAVKAQENSINLLPHEVKYKKRRKIQTASLKFAVFSSVCVILLLMFISQSRINKLQNEYAERINTLTELDQIRVLKNDVRKRQQLVSQIQHNKTPMESVLKLIGHQLNDNIVLNNLHGDQEGHFLSISGKVFGDEISSQSQLTNFIKYLGEAKHFNEARLVFSKRNGDAQEFEIMCNLNYGQ